jgi:DNA-binding CsgD family transcriptional regulator
VRTRCKNGSAYALSFYPLTAHLSEILKLPTFLVPRRVALLVVRSIQREEAEGRAGLWRDLGLTPAERRLADELCAGHSLRQSADCLGVAYDTARNQLKAIFAKAGVNRQAALVALVARLMDRGQRPGP